MKEVNEFLKSHPKIKERGIECFEDIRDLKKWLLSKTAHFNYQRVIDQSENEILEEIGRIEHGIF